MDYSYSFCSVFRLLKTENAHWWMLVYNLIWSNSPLTLQPAVHWFLHGCSPSSRWPPHQPGSGLYCAISMCAFCVGALWLIISPLNYIYAKLTSPLTHCHGVKTTPWTEWQERMKNLFWRRRSSECAEEKIAYQSLRTRDERLFSAGALPSASRRPASQAAREWSSGVVFFLLLLLLRPTLICLFESRWRRRL